MEANELRHDSRRREQLKVAFTHLSAIWSVSSFLILVVLGYSMHNRRFAPAFYDHVFWFGKLCSLKSYEAAQVSLGWCLYKFQSKKLHWTSFYFTAFTSAISNLIFIFFAGNCVFLVCPKSIYDSRCHTVTYLNNGPFIAYYCFYLLTQIITLALFYVHRGILRGNKMVMKLMKLEERSTLVNSNQIFHENLILFLACLLFLTAADIAMLYSLYEPHSIHYGLFPFVYPALPSLAIILKVVAVLTTLYGVKKRHTGALLNSLSTVILQALIQFVAFSIYFYTRYNHRLYEAPKLHGDGKGRLMPPVYYLTPSPDTVICVPVVLLVMGLFLYGCSLMSLFVLRKHFLKLNNSHNTIENVLLPKIPASAVSILHRGQLGNGYFAQVYKATVVREDCTEIIVAAKWLKDFRNLEDFFFAKSCLYQEIFLLSHLKHGNIIQAYGLCVDSMNSIILCMEFSSIGSLEKHLEKETTRNLATEKDLIVMLLDVLNACKYLEQQGCVHRDISAKNVLLFLRERMICKLADFGLAKDVKTSGKYEKGRAKLPLKYTAPECIITGEASSKSDVWSFGILIWEVYTFGHEPYENHGHLEASKLVTERQTLLTLYEALCQLHIPAGIQELMKSCFAFSPSDRPRFNGQAMEEKLTSQMANAAVDQPYFKLPTLQYEPTPTIQVQLGVSPSSTCGTWSCTELAVSRTMPQNECIGLRDAYYN